MISDNDSRHGTTNGYNNQGCRCQPCKTANALAHKDYVHRLKLSGLCRRCARPIGQSKSVVFCASCREKETRQFMHRYYELKEDGLCARCARPLNSNKSKVHCLRCRAKIGLKD